MFLNKTVATSVDVVFTKRRPSCLFRKQGQFAYSQAKRANSPIWKHDAAATSDSPPNYGMDLRAEVAQSMALNKEGDVELDLAVPCLSPCAHHAPN